MLIKEAKFKNVKKIVKQRVSDEVYGCDECKSEIKDFPQESQRLELTVFHHTKDSYHLHFCSWNCVFKHLPKINTDYFVSLPFVYFDEKEPSKRSSKALMKIIKHFQ